MMKKRATLILYKACLERQDFLVVPWRNCWSCPDRLFDGKKWEQRVKGGMFPPPDPHFSVHFHFFKIFFVNLSIYFFWSSFPWSLFKEYFSFPILLSPFQNIFLILKCTSDPTFPHHFHSLKIYFSKSWPLFLLVVIHLITFTFQDYLFPIRWLLCPSLITLKLSDKLDGHRLVIYTSISISDWEKKEIWRR